MALRHIEGFEHEDLNAARQLLSVEQADFVTGSSRSGSGNVHLKLLSSEEWFTKIVLCTTNSELHCGFAVRPPTVLTNSNGVVVLSGMQTGGSPTADSSCLQFKWTADGTPFLYVKGDGEDVDVSTARIGTPIEGSPGDIQGDTWHYVEIRWLPHASAGQTEFWIDGVSIGSTSGTDTLGDADTTQIDEVWMIITGESGSNSTLFDDIYILDAETTSPEGGTSPNVTLLGDIVIEALVPDADNTPEDWTLSTGSDSFALVDEIPNTGDTDYIESNNATDETRLDLAARVHTGTVIGVQTQVAARKTGANARTLDFGIVSNAGATKETAPPEKTLSVSYNHFQKLYDRDPVDEATAADWDTTKVNALEVFVEVAS